MSVTIRPSNWTCDSCERVLEHGEVRFNCIECDDYDHCETCVAKRPKAHPHRMVPELAYGNVEIHGDPFTDMPTGVRKAISMFSDRHCLGVRDVDPKDPSIYTDTYSWLTYKTIGKRITNFSHGLRRLIEPRGYLGICSANRPEWIITDFACLLQSFISVPIYCLFNDREIAHVIKNTQISTVVCDKGMLPKFIQLSVECSSLRHIVCMDPISDTKTSESSVRIRQCRDRRIALKQSERKIDERRSLRPMTCLMSF